MLRTVLFTVCCLSIASADDPSSSTVTGPDAVASTAAPTGTPDASAETTSDSVDLFAVPEGAVELLSKDKLNPAAWLFVSAKRDVAPADTWQLKQIDGEPVLEGSGQPFGLIRTKAEYGNYRLGLQWRFTEDPEGNSGVLLHTGNKPTVWPKAVQVQFHLPELGSVFPVGGATIDGELRRTDLQAKPAGEWNSCIISSNNGSLTVQINGTDVGTVNKCEPSRGGIALQSEGSVVQFRRVWVLPTADAMKTVPPTTVPDEVAVEPVESTTDSPTTGEAAKKKTADELVPKRKPVPVGDARSRDRLHTVSRLA